MPQDASTALANAGVTVAVLPSDAASLVVAPRQLAKAVDVLSSAGWEQDLVNAGGTGGLPGQLVLSSPVDGDVTLVASLVADPELRALFPIRTIDALHRSGQMFRPVNPLHPVDVVLHACMHHASTGDLSLLDRAVPEVAAWDVAQRQAFAEIVRRAGAQLPVLVALDSAAPELALPIGPQYKLWRWAARRSPVARRHTRRSTVGSLRSLLGLRHRRRADDALRGAPTLVEAIAHEGDAVQRYAPHSRWRSLAALPTRQLVDVFRIGIALARVERMLQTKPFTEVIERTGVTLDSGGAVSPNVVCLPGWAQEDARLVERVGRILLPGNPCLRTSIVIAQRLRQFDPIVRIGVSGTDGSFDSAHAWVDVAGISFGESERFEPFVGSGPAPG